MKKLLCIVMAVIMLLGLCACGGNSEEDVRGSISGGISTQPQKETEEATDAPTDAPTEEPTVEATEEAPQFSLGSSSSNTYTNSFLGLSCTLPENWTFATDEEILQMNNIASSMMDEETAKAIAEANIVYDMFAQSTTGSSINVNLEKVTAIQSVMLDVKQTLEAQLPTIKSTFENMGYTNVQAVYQTVTIDGQEFDGLAISAEIQGMTFYEILFSFKKENYLANVTLGTIQAEELEVMLNSFTIQ